MDRAEALAILNRATDVSSAHKGDTPEVRAALKVLLLLSTTREFLDWYWESAADEDPIGRAQNMRAALNGIERHLR